MDKARVAAMQEARHKAEQLASQDPACLPLESRQEIILVEVEVIWLLL
jgi:hypothetical protein